jgi:hypothetical protein
MKSKAMKNTPQDSIDRRRATIEPPDFCDVVAAMLRIQPGRGNPPAQAVIQDVDGVSLLW